MSVRYRHTIAYAASMLALLLLQITLYFEPFVRFSDYGIDVVYTLISQLFCMGVLPLTILLVLNKGNTKDLFARMRYKAPRDARVCALVSLGMMLLITPYTMAFNALTNLLFKIIGYKKGFPIGTVYLGVGDFWIAVVLTAVLPAVFEEFTNRGVLLSGLQSRGSEYSAVVVGAVMFGLMHQNPSQLIFAVFGGLAFGVAAVKCDSVIPAMCAHFGNNIVAVVLDYSTQRETPFGVWYEKLFSSNSILSIAVVFFILGLSLYGMVKLLQYAARKAPKPVSEKKLFGLVTLDAYSPEGKATLKDNAFLYATAITEGAFVLILLLWGILK